MTRTWQLRALAVYFFAVGPLATSCAKQSGSPDLDDGGATGGKSTAGGAGKAGGTGKAGSSGSFGGTSSTGGTPAGGKGGTAGSGVAEGGDSAASGEGGGGTGGTTSIPPDVLERASAIVHYMCSATAERTNQVQMSLRLENKSTDPLSMADVTIRYWLTPEATLELHQYYVHASLLGPKAELVTDGDESYVLLSFSGGSVPPKNMLNEAEVQLAAANNTMQLDQTNDFSFDPTATTYKPNPRITLYLGEKLIWGCEPSGVCVGEATGEGGAGAGGAGVGGEAASGAAGMDAGGAPSTDAGGAPSTDASGAAGGP